MNDSNLPFQIRKAIEAAEDERAINDRQAFFFIAGLIAFFTCAYFLAPEVERIDPISLYGQHPNQTECLVISDALQYHPACDHATKSP